jgi:hypothetical protein
MLPVFYAVEVWSVVYTSLQKFRRRCEDTVRGSVNSA